MFVRLDTGLVIDGVLWMDSVLARTDIILKKKNLQILYSCLLLLFWLYSQTDGSSPGSFSSDKIHHYGDNYDVTSPYGMYRENSR